MRKIFALEQAIRRSGSVRPLARPSAQFSSSSSSNNNSNNNNNNNNNNSNNNNEDDEQVPTFFYPSQELIDLATAPLPGWPVPPPEPDWNDPHALFHEPKKPRKRGKSVYQFAEPTAKSTFTCYVCQHTCEKNFTIRAYRYGIVIACCPNCKSKHLVADKLGYFGECPMEDDIRQLLDEHRGCFTMIKDGDLEIDLEKLIGHHQFVELLDKAYPDDEEEKALKADKAAAKAAREKP